MTESQKPAFLNQEGSFAPLLFPDEPDSRFTKRDLDRFLIWASEAGASDISFTTDEQVFIEVSGRMHRATKRALSNPEIFDILGDTFGSQAIKAKLAGPADEDYAYDLRPDRDRRFRFRVNGTGLVSQGVLGAQVTMRTIPSIPPRLRDLKVEEAIVRNMAPKQGMILITGQTGSGKSTLLAAMLRELMEDPHGHRKILTYESPIEYVYDEVTKPTTLVAQTEIGRNLPNFTAGTRNALRRKPSIILVGESRDAETVGEAIIASMTGHLLYTTVHSNGFADTVRRMVSVFPEGERNARAVDLLTSLKMCVSQTLVPNKTGGRIALREFVVMNREIVNRLLEEDLDRLTLASIEILKDYGQSFLQDAQRKYDAGLISRETLSLFEYGDKGLVKDAEELERSARAVRPLASSEGLRTGAINLDHHDHGEADPRLSSFGEDPTP
jgi:defect-in-organelle-trafficking protein DotB